jgi:hypothetical protein
MRRFPSRVNYEVALSVSHAPFQPVGVPVSRIVDVINTFRGLATVGRIVSGGD